MSRRIAVELYEKIVALRPDWHDRRPDAGQDQGRHDRLGRRPAGVPAAPPHQGRPQRPQGARQGPGRPARARHRPRHVADRLRRPVDAHHVRRQADAGRRAHAGHRPGQPHLPRQARRPDRRLHRRRRRTCRRRSPSTRRPTATRPACRSRRWSPSCWRSTTSCAASCTAAPSTRRPDAARRPSAWPSTPRCSTSSWPTRTARARFLDQVLALAKAFALAAPATRRWRSATTSGSSPTSAPRS